MDWRFRARVCSILLFDAATEDEIKVFVLFTGAHATWTKAFERDSSLLIDASLCLHEVLLSVDDGNKPAGTLYRSICQRT